MKKRILLAACAWLLCLGHASADELVIGDVTVPQGGTAELTVGYGFTSTTDKVGFTFSVALPEGFSFATDEDGDPLYVKDATSIDKLNVVCAGEGNFAGQPANATATIKGTSGTLLTLTLKADAGLTVGSTYDVSVTKVTFQERVDGSVRDINLSDFAFTVTVGEPDDGRLKFDENATRLPTYTAGDKADVTVTRTIKGGEWSTLVLPFNLTRANATAVFGSDVQFAKFTGYTIDYGDDEENVTPLGITINLTDYAILARGNLAGGTPVLIKTSQDIAEIRLDGVTLTSDVNDAQGPDTDYDLPGTLTGSLVKSTIPADGLFLSGNQFWYSAGKTSVKAFRCWFELGAVLDKETDFGARVMLHFGNEETGVQEIVNLKSVNGECYDLLGRRVGAALNDKGEMRNDKVRKGLYIVNGKKVIK